MRRLEVELVNKMIMSRQELVMADILNPDYERIKSEAERCEKLYNRYMECCGYTRYWYINGNACYGDYRVVGVWIRGNHKNFHGYKLYRNWLDAELVCNHMVAD